MELFILIAYVIFYVAFMSIWCLKDYLNDRRQHNDESRKIY